MDLEDPGDVGSGLFGNTACTNAVMTTPPISFRSIQQIQRIQIFRLFQLFL